MVSATTYKIYLSGTPASPSFSGDIDPATHLITMTALGPSIIDIELTWDSPMYDAASPITFDGDVQPDLISWALVSPSEILITNMNVNSSQFPFTLAFSDATGAVIPGVDPTIVNTYVPPTPMTPECRPALVARRRVA
jgi:hypothetical protein